MVRLGRGLRGTMASARSAGTIEMGGKGWRGGLFRKTRRERGADRLRSVTSEQRSDCGRSRSQHNRSNSIVPAQKALGRMSFRAAREWVWCSPPRRATAKVPLACLRTNVLPRGKTIAAVQPRSRCRQDRATQGGWVDLRSAPTGHCIPAQGETLGIIHTKPMRSEGTPHRESEF